MGGKLNKRNIENNFLRLNSKLEELGVKLQLVVIGGANIVFQYNPIWRDKTFDIDVLLFADAPPGIGSVLTECECHVQSDVFFQTHPDWLNRVEVMRKFSHLVVLSPNVYDIAISKISRGYEKDINDIIESDIFTKIDINKLEKMYRESSRYWVERPREFELNWESFKEKYQQKILIYGKSL